MTPARLISRDRIDAAYDQLATELAAANARIREIELYALTLKDDDHLLARLEALLAEIIPPDPQIGENLEKYRERHRKWDDRDALRRVIGLLKEETK